MDNSNRVTYFAQTDSRNRRVKFGIKTKDRSRHMYVIGKTGMGKSTLLENIAIQDVQNGEGMAFIDPHGKSAELLLDYVPQNRIDDVLYFAPFDMEYPVGFNIMEDVNPDRRHLVVNGLMSTFEKIWEDAWSARMAYILQNTIHALLEYPGATLLDVNRMYTNKPFREKVVANIEDPSVRSFWVDEFANYSDRYAQEATPAIQNKIGQLAANPVIRNIIGQTKSSFDIRDIMDKKKCIIVNLSKGKVGETNANLLGALMINKIYLGAMSRADVSEAELQYLPNFYLHVDEFQSFANRSFADILSESRKYKLNLTMAHQYIEQMSDEVRAAVFGNVGTMITFRVGAYDAEILEKEFQPQFTVQDIVSLDFAQIYLKLMIDGVASPPFSAVTLPPIKKDDISYHDDILVASRKQYARTRHDVELSIKEWQGKENKDDTKKQNKGGKHNTKKTNNKDSGKDKRKEKNTSTTGTHKTNNKGRRVTSGNDHENIQRDTRTDTSATKQYNKKTTHAPSKDLRSTLSRIVGSESAQNKQSSSVSGKTSDVIKDTQNSATERSKSKSPPTPPEGASGVNALREALKEIGFTSDNKQSDSIDDPSVSKSKKKQNDQTSSGTQIQHAQKETSQQPFTHVGNTTKNISDNSVTDTEKRDTDQQTASDRNQKSNHDSMYTKQASDDTDTVRSNERSHDVSKRADLYSSHATRSESASAQDDKEDPSDNKNNSTSDKTTRVENIIHTHTHEEQQRPEVPREVLEELLSMNDAYDQETVSFEERQKDREK